MIVRRATVDDAADAVALMRRSIVELCSLDHRGDAGEMARWLGNKTVANWRAWLEDRRLIALVTERRGRLLGVGMLTCRGEILLNYVHPDARFQGVSKAMIAAMEAEASGRGLDRCFLESTRAARTLYARCGYAPIGGGADDLHLEKRLPPAPTHVPARRRDRRA